MRLKENKWDTGAQHKWFTSSVQYTPVDVQGNFRWWQVSSSTHSHQLKQLLHCSLTATSPLPSKFTQQKWIIRPNLILRLLCLHCIYFRHSLGIRFNLLPSTKRAHHACGSGFITVPDLLSPLDAGTRCLGLLVHRKTELWIESAHNQGGTKRALPSQPHHCCNHNTNRCICITHTSTGKWMVNKFAGFPWVAGMDALFH